MQRLLHGPLRLRYSPTGEQIQNGRTADEIPWAPITPWCGPPLFCPCFPLQKLLCWKFRNLLLRNIALVYFTLLYSLRWTLRLLRLVAFKVRQRSAFGNAFGRLPLEHKQRTWLRWLGQIWFHRVVNRRFGVVVGLFIPLHHSDYLSDKRRLPAT